MRRIATSLILLCCAAAATGPFAGSAAARSSSQYRIEGRGWGHGIGMSQYGANGYANRGLTGEQIIQHYFTGTVVAPAPSSAPASLRVLLQSHLAPARIQLTSAGTLGQGAARLDLLPDDVVELRAVGTKLAAVRVRAGVRTPVAQGSAADATITPSVDGGVRALFASDHASFGTSFRGTLTGHVFEGKVSVVNTLPMEQYLRGVVPDEMPPSWHPEALKAQAIAARSYALRGLKKEFSWFDLYSDTRSQVYGGIGAEEESTDTAISATANTVARVGSASGDVAQTFFFSTSGGRTAANEDVWGSTPYPYLRSVASPYETASKYFAWKGLDIQRYTPAQLAAKLGGASGRFVDATQTLRPSGYVDKVLVRGSAGTRTLRGSDVQYKLGLRSTYFRIVPLSISGPNTARPGTYVKIGGRAPRTGSTFVTLAQAGVVGKPIKVKVAKNGLWSIRAKVRANLVARMTRSGILGPAISVSAGTPTTVVAASRR